MTPSPMERNQIGKLSRDEFESRVARDNYEAMVAMTTGDRRVNLFSAFRELEDLGMGLTHAQRAILQIHLEVKA